MDPVPSISPAAMAAIINRRAQLQQQEAQAMGQPMPPAGPFSGAQAMPQQPGPAPIGGMSQSQFSGYPASGAQPGMTPQQRQQLLQLIMRQRGY